MSFHVKSKWVIGLTGSMLSGKSTALAYFKACGAGTVSCDEIVHALYARPAVQQKIKAALGTADKTQLAQLVFKNKLARKRLEQLLHPLVEKEIRACLRKPGPRVWVVEIPLLFEAGWHTKTDLNIAVLAAQQTLPARLKGRNLTRAEYERRTRYQLPPEQKAARADVVFYHAGKAQLKQRVMRFCQAMNLLHNVK